MAGIQECDIQLRKLLIQNKVREPKIDIPQPNAQFNSHNNQISILEEIDRFLKAKQKIETNFAIQATIRGYEFDRETFFN